MIGLFKYTFSGSGGSQDLQSVTDIGNSTSDGIICIGNPLVSINPGVSEITIGNLEITWNDFGGNTTTLSATYPIKADRVILLQDGDGTLAFLTDIPSSQDLQAVTDVGNITTHNILCNTIQVINIPNGGYASISCGDSTFNYSDPGADRNFVFDYSLVTTGIIRSYNLPDKNGTIALLDDIPSGVTSKANYTNAISVGTSTLIVPTPHNPTYVGGITPKNADTAANFYNTLGFSIAYGVGRFTITFYIGTGVIGTTWDFDYLISFT